MQRCFPKILLSSVMIVPTVGCGTLLTRLTISGQHTHPYAAVVRDFQMISDPGWAEFMSVRVKAGRSDGLISIPLDLAIDTLLLPVDIVRWTFGISGGTTMVRSRPNKSTQADDASPRTERTRR